MVQEFSTVPELETGTDGFAHFLVMLGMLTPQQLAKVEKSVVKDVTSWKAGRNLGFVTGPKRPDAAVSFIGSYLYSSCLAHLL